MASTPATSSSESTRRRRLGEIALEKGLISRPQLDEALANQAELKKLGLSERIGAILFKKRLITKQALQDLLLTQAPAVRRVGNFEILEKLGQGAMGVVFKARQVSMDRVVALKILAPRFAGDPAFTERFVREARAAGQFNHLHIVAAVDVGYAEPYHYFAMEYVEGKTLRQVLRERGALPEKEALRIAAQVAAGLEHALERKIIHRDVKPENIMLSSDGVAKLLDLGLACAVGAGGDDDEGADDPQRSQSITKGRKAVGTPHYISPEAARGEPDVDTRADVYSLGCTLYHLLTGRTPFDGHQGREVMQRHVAERVPDVRAARPELAPDTARIVARMTQRERAARYADPAQARADLEAALEGRTLPHLGAEKPSGANTTGPRAPISPPRGGGATTGPRRPIAARGTTGPRAPVQPRHTTGPAVPIAGDRTAGVSVSVLGRAADPGLPRPSRRASGVWVGLASVLAGMLALAAIFSASGPQPLDKGRGGGQENHGAKPGEQGVKPGEQAARLKSTDVAGPLQASRKKEDPAASAALTRAQAALDAAERLRKERPDDHAALWPAYEQAAGLAHETPLAAAAQAAWQDARARGEKALDLALQGLRARADEAKGRGAFAAAAAALALEAWPPELRVGDWQARLEASRRALAEAAEAQAAAGLEEARTLARAGGASDLERAIALARKAEALPPALAPSALKAADERAGWEARLAEARKAAEAARQEEERRGRELLASARKELDGLLRQNRFPAALEWVERKLRDPALAPAAASLRREQADIETILALRRKAVELLRAQPGKELSLRKGRTVFQGTLKADPASSGVTLKLRDGPELSLPAEQLDAEDVDAHLPPPASAEEFRQRGLLFLAAGLVARAKESFTRAHGAGLEAAAPYLERIETIELGEAEVRARKAWAEAEALVTAKKWKEAKAALEAFLAQYAATPCGLEKKAEAEKLLAEVTNQILFGSAPSEGLKLWLRLDEIQGAVAVNSALKGGDATLQGGAWAAGRLAGALSLDGNNQCAVTADLKEHFPDENVTVALWFNAAGPGVLVAELGQPAINRDWHDSQLEVLADGEVKARVWGLNPISLGKVGFNEWHHAALRYDKAAATLDGFLDGNKAVGESKGDRQAPQKQGHALIYALGATDGTNMGSGAYFKGLLDDLRVYNRPLKAEEVKALAATGVQASKP